MSSMWGGSRDDGLLVHQRDLLAQFENAVLPVALRVEPREGRRKGGIVPALRDPCRVVQETQSAQRLDEVQLAAVECAELLVALEHPGELVLDARAVSRQQHPQVLHRGRGARIVEVDEVRSRVVVGDRPQHVARVDITVHAQRAHVACTRIRAAHTGQRLCADARVGLAKIIGQPAAVEQERAWRIAEGFRRQRGPLREGPRGADGVDAREIAAEPHQHVVAVELGRAAAMLGVDRIAKSGVGVQRPAGGLDRRHRGHFARAELGDERMLLGGFSVAPSRRARRRASVRNRQGRACPSCCIVRFAHLQPTGARVFDYCERTTMDQADDSVMPVADGYVYRRHALPVRIMHWINVVALTILLMSGLGIFNAHPALYWGQSSYNGKPPILTMTAADAPNGDKRGVTRIFGHEFSTDGLFGVSAQPNGQRAIRGFPWWMTIPDLQWLSMSRSWHFFFAWLLVANGLAYVVYSIRTRHLARDLAPTRGDVAGIRQSIVDHLHFRHPAGEESKRYNVLQKFAYLFVIFVLLPLTILMGLGMSPWLDGVWPVSYTHLRAHETGRNLVCRLLLE